MSQTLTSQETHSTRTLGSAFLNARFTGEISLAVRIQLRFHLTGKLNDNVNPQDPGTVPTRGTRKQNGVDSYSRP